MLARGEAETGRAARRLMARRLTVAFERAVRRAVLLADNADEGALVAGLTGSRRRPCTARGWDRMGFRALERDAAVSEPGSRWART